MYSILEEKMEIYLNESVVDAVPVFIDYLAMQNRSGIVIEQSGDFYHADVVVGCCCWPW